MAVLRCCRFFQFALVYSGAGYSYNSIITETKNDWLNESEIVKKESERKKTATLCSASMESATENQRERERGKNLTSHLISCGFGRCVWFVVHNALVRGWIMPPFYESFELVPSEVLRSSVGRSLFMAIRCTRHASEKHIKKIHRFSSSLALTLRHYFARCGDCQRFIGNFNIIVKNLSAQKSISNENRIFSSLVQNCDEKWYLWWWTRVREPEFPSMLTREFVVDFYYVLITYESTVRPNSRTI